MRLSRKEFKAWLEAKRPREIVGYCGSANECPLATFTGTRVGGSCQDGLPLWASEFVEIVDRYKPDGAGRPVTAARALRILEEVGQ